MLSTSLTISNCSMTVTSTSPTATTYRCRVSKRRSENRKHYEDRSWSHSDCPSGHNHAPQTSERLRRRLVSTDPQPCRDTEPDFPHYTRAGRHLCRSTARDRSD